MDSQWKLSHMHLKKPMRWPCVQMKRSSPSCEPVFLLSALFWLFSCLGCKVVDRCVIYDYEMARKFCLLLWNFAKHSIAICSRHCFYLSVSKRFFMSEFSDNMRCTAVFEIPTMSPSSCTFSRRSSSAAFWIVCTTSGVVTSFGRLLQCSCWQLVRFPSNSSTQYDLSAFGPALSVCLLLKCAASFLLEN